MRHFHGNKLGKHKRWLLVHITSSYPFGSNMFQLCCLLLGPRHLHIPSLSNRSPASPTGLMVDQLAMSAPSSILYAFREQVQLLHHAYTYSPSMRVMQLQECHSLYTHITVSRCHGPHCSEACLSRCCPATVKLRCLSMLTNSLVSHQDSTGL